MIVPLECDAAVLGGLPVHGQFIERGESVNQVLCMFLADVFDTEIVDDE